MNSSAERLNTLERELGAVEKRRHHLATEWRKRKQQLLPVIRLSYCRMILALIQSPTLVCRGLKLFIRCASGNASLFLAVNDVRFQLIGRSVLERTKAYYEACALLGDSQQVNGPSEFFQSSTMMPLRRSIQLLANLRKQSRKWIG